MTLFSSFFAQLLEVIPPDMMMTISMVIVGIGTALVVFIIAYPFVRPRAETDTEEDAENEKGIFGSLTPALAAVIPEADKERQDFGQLLRQAGIYQASARNSIYALRLLLLLVPIFLAMYLGVLVPKNMATYLFIGVLTGSALFVVPRLSVYFIQKKRMEDIRRGLADTIDMFGMCASGGMTTSESLEYVSQQLNEYPELARELRILRRQAEVGSLEVAAADLVQRVNIREMRQFANLLLRGSKLGQQMSGTMNEQADHLRVTRRHMAMAQANKTPTKLVFPLMFCFAPAALIMLLAPSLVDVMDFMTNTQDMSAQSVVESMNNTSQIGIETGGITASPAE